MNSGPWNATEIIAGERIPRSIKSDRRSRIKVLAIAAVNRLNEDDLFLRRGKLVSGIHFPGIGRRNHGGIHGDWRRSSPSPRDGAFSAPEPALCSRNIFVYAITSAGARRSAALLEGKAG